MMKLRIFDQYDNQVLTKHDKQVVRLYFGAFGICSILFFKVIIPYFWNDTLNESLMAAIGIGMLAFAFCAIATLLNAYKKAYKGNG